MNINIRKLFKKYMYSEKKESITVPAIIPIIRKESIPARILKEREKREKKNEEQKRYRARKKMEKQGHEFMLEVHRLNKEHMDQYDRFDILDLEE
jgi:hypothetical protein